jgi:cytoskeletal protein CcmA (bactofilin family)
MLNFNRNDRSGDTRAGDKGLAKPAAPLPSASTPSTASIGRYVAAGAPAPATPGPSAAPVQVKHDAPEAPATGVPAHNAPATGGSRLIVGRNVKLKGVEISDCDMVVVEGQVEASVVSKGMQIAKPGTLKGTAVIDVAEIDGDFTGELTAHTKLVVNGTGRVSGTIRYGSLIVAEGGEVTGDVKRLDDASAPTLRQAVDPRATATNAAH